MERFVAKQNIEHFRELLKHEQDAGQRARLQQLLSAEEAKLSAMGPWTDSTASAPGAQHQDAAGAADETDNPRT